jgi:hypothetical protein
MIDPSSIGLIRQFINLCRWALRRQRRLGADGLGPTEVVVKWQESLRNGDLKFVYSHTYLQSKLSRDYVQKKWGSLEGLAKKYANQMPADEFYLSEQIEPLSARSAKVTYETRYDDGAKRTWTDYLVLDESIWKVRPEHVEWREDRPPHAIP